MSNILSALKIKNAFYEIYLLISCVLSSCKLIGNAVFFKFINNIKFETHLYYLHFILNEKNISTYFNNRETKKKV